MPAICAQPGARGPFSIQTASATTNADAIAAIKPEASPVLNSVLNLADRLGVTVYPMALPSGDPKNFEQFDRLTLAVPGASGSGLATSRLAVADLEFDLEEMTVVEAGHYTEFTGYPSFRGVA